jgi:apolipoprotein N-acyltransferase
VEKEPPPRLSIHALGRGALATMLALRALALVNVAYLVWHVLGDLFEGTQTAPAPLVGAGLVLLSGLPWLAALAIRRAGRGALVIEAEQLVVDLGRTRFEIPIAKVRGLRGAALPWPEHTIALVLASGKPFERSIAADDPRALLEALRRAAPDARVQVPEAPLTFAAELRARTGRPRRLAPIKWGALPLVLAVIAFRLQQILMFGGPFGQYRQAGLGPYLIGFFDICVSVFGDLILYATTVRFVLEIGAFAATWIAPRAARKVRLGAEALAFIAFFVVIPAFLASRLLG